MKSLSLIFLTAALLAGCQTYADNQSRRSKIAQFIVNHPVAARSIGVEDNKTINITSNAVRFSEHTGLSKTAPEDSQGTQTNAFRHTLWQAAIASQFDSEIAAQAGDAYLTDAELREGKTTYFSRKAADQAVAVRNNRIGRSIGSGKPNADMKTLSRGVLFYYNTIGLWTSEVAQTDGRNVWQIKQHKISNDAYHTALKNIEALDENGMTSEEKKQYSPNSLREIKKSVRSIQKVSD